MMGKILVVSNSTYSIPSPTGRHLRPGERKDLNPPSTEWINGSATRTIGDSLYGGTIMTCATCHDIHNNFTSAVSYPAPNYYTYTNKKDLCLTCHLSW